MASTKLCDDSVAAVVDDVVGASFFCFVICSTLPFAGDVRLVSESARTEFSFVIFSTIAG